MSSELTLNRLSYTFPNSDQSTLEDLSLWVQKREFILCRGSSGSGKSTLARIIAGLLPNLGGGKLDGKLFLDGSEYSELSELEFRKRVGFVFQDPEKQVFMNSVERELVFGLENLGLDLDEIEKRLDKVVRAFGLQSYLDRELVTLSGGELQKVVLASTLAMEPSFLVLDEPTSQLSPSSTEDFFKMLRNYQEQFGTTVVVFEHHEIDLPIEVDRKLFLKNGKILQGEPKGLDFALRSSLHDFNPLAHRGEAVVRLKNLIYELSETKNTVINGLNYDFYQSASHAIVGDNGSGKTTLLKLLSGRLSETAGFIERKYKKVSYLPSNPNLYFFYSTVEEEINATVNSLSGDLSDRAAIYLAKQNFPLCSHPFDLSFGQRKYLAFCLVAAIEPDMLLLDEPTRGLDDRYRELLANKIESLVQNKCCVVFTSHDERFVGSIANFVLSLDEEYSEIEGVAEVRGERVSN